MASEEKLAATAAAVPVDAIGVPSKPERGAQDAVEHLDRPGNSARSSGSAADFEGAAKPRTKPPAAGQRGTPGTSHERPTKMTPEEKAACTAELLAELEAIQAAALQAETIAQVKALRERANAVCKRARTSRLGLPVVNRAIEVKLIAERRGGEMLAEHFPHGGDRRSAVRPPITTLRDVGITRNMSARWRLEASVDDPTFRDYVQEANERGERICAMALVRLARGEPAFPKGAASVHARRAAASKRARPSRAKRNNVVPAGVEVRDRTPCPPKTLP